MSESRPELRDELDLTVLREHHLNDGLDPATHAALLARIEERCALPLAPLPKPPRARWQAGARAWAAAAILVGAVGFAALGVRKPRVSIQPEPAALERRAAPVPPHVPVAPVASLSPSELPCVRAQGDAGQLLQLERALRVMSASGRLDLPTATGPALRIPELDGRRGEWFHARHIQGQEGLSQLLQVLPSAKRTHGSGYTLKVAGPAPTGWGANAGIRFDRCYDASAYEGFEFRARGTGALWVGFQTPDSVPREFGGHCADKCWYTRGRTIALSKQFRTYRVRWSDVNSTDGELGVESRILQLMFSIQSGPDPYEFWIETARFIPPADRPSAQ
jgi:hypothetical protein